MKKQKMIASLTTIIFGLSMLIFMPEIGGIEISQAHQRSSGATQTTTSSGKQISSPVPQDTQKNSKTNNRTANPKSKPNPNAQSNPPLTFKANRPSKNQEAALIQKVINSQGFIFPVSGNAYFVNNFGEKRKGYLHQGVDIQARQGTPVVAVEAGLATPMFGANAGNYVVLKSKSGMRYRYMHLSKFAKRGRVRTGDIIGYVGNTGNAINSKPHLHFEMWQGNLLINPYLLLKTFSPKKRAAAPAKPRR